MRLAALAAALTFTAALAACDSEAGPAPCPEAGPLAIVDSVEVPGTGQAATPNSIVSVYYRGGLVDGTGFDSTRTTGPTRLALGGTVPGFRFGIGGTDEFPGMRIGGSRRLVIPPQLAYGTAPPQGSIIPSCATLVFDVRLVDLG